MKIVIDLASHIDEKAIILKSIEIKKPFSDHYVIFIDHEFKKIIRSEAKKRAKMLLAKKELLEEYLK